jgi:hypothetical protein
VNARERKPGRGVVGEGKRKGRNYFSQLAPFYECRREQEQHIKGEKNLVFTYSISMEYGIFFSCPIEVRTPAGKLTVKSNTNSLLDHRDHII